jgi:hypothetical protein
MDVNGPLRTRALTPRVNESYLDQLAKLVPGESVAGFLAIKNYMGTYANTDPTLFWIPILLGLGICVYVRGYLSGDANGKWNFPLLAVSLVAFAIWAINIIAGPFQGEAWKVLAEAGLVAMSLIGPDLYKRLGGTKAP